MLRRNGIFGIIGSHRRGSRTYSRAPRADRFFGGRPDTVPGQWRGAEKTISGARVNTVTDAQSRVMLAVWRARKLKIKTNKINIKNSQVTTESVSVYR